MTRGRLSEEKAEEIKAYLPDTSGVRNKMWKILRDQLEMSLGADLRITDPRYAICLVCLQDAGDVALEVGHALFEAYANLAWFREESPDAPVGFFDVFYSKFYADDAALRLYAAGEHAANFIQAFLGIDNSDLKPYRKEGQSHATTVGKYMIAERPGHRITELIQDLINDQDWKDTRYYRNRWVHEQPPLVSGKGLVFKRRSSWEKAEDGKHVILFGGGDPHEYELEEVLDMVSGASHDFATLLSGLADVFFDHLEDLGLGV